MEQRFIILIKSAKLSFRYKYLTCLKCTISLNHLAVQISLK